METSGTGERGEMERALDLLFGANRPARLHGDAFRREVREAFRRRALETHPDRAQALGRSEASLAEDFRRILEAYQVLSREEASPAPRPVAQRPGARLPPAPGPSYHASMPHRTLLFAEFLYYSGRASWRNLVEAVAWQRRQRPAIGRIAVEWGHLSDDEVREILDRRRREGSGGSPSASSPGAADSSPAAQLLALLGRQRRLQRRIGQFFVETGHRGRTGDPVARPGPLPSQRALAQERLKTTAGYG